MLQQGRIGASSGTLTIHTDASVRGRTARLAWVFMVNGRPQHSGFQDAPGWTDSTLAEVAAVIGGVAAATCWPQVFSFREILICCDSQTVVNHFTGEAVSGFIEAGALGLMDVFEQARLLLPPLRIAWVPRSHNGRADAVARQPVAPTGAQSRSQERIRVAAEARRAANASSPGARTGRHRPAPLATLGALAGLREKKEGS